MEKAKQALKITATLTLIFFFLSCNSVVKNTQSDTMLIVTNITGKDIEDNEVNFLQSDVVQVDPDTNQLYVTADSATATLTAKSLEPEPTLGTSNYSNILVTSYTVSYTRSDGKNREGIDVPYSFSASLSVLVEVDATVDVPFIIVRESAKLEPPLINLREGRGEGPLTVQAKVDFYGHDMANHKVKATGYLTIFFANYIDQEG